MSNQKSKPINLLELRYKMTGRLESAGNIKPEIGKTYLPPMTLKMVNSAPKKKHLLTVSDVTLPTSFSWSRPQDITKRNNSLPNGQQSIPQMYINSLIMLPPNQYACGSCYSFATTTALSDRAAIAGYNNYTNPQLDPTYLLSYTQYSQQAYPPSDPNNCDPTSAFCDNGCLGGEIAQTLIAMSSADSLNPSYLKEYTGGTNGSCWNYNWCSSLCSCNPGQSEDCDSITDKDQCVLKPGCYVDYDNSCKSCKITGITNDNLNCAIPQYDPTKCHDNNTTPTLVKVLAGSVHSFNVNDPDVITQMQNDIYTYGPMPIGFMVYNDFMLGDSSGSTSLMWTSTNNVYIRRDTFDDDSSLYSCDSTSIGKGNCSGLDGGHAVVIVGWGVAPQITMPDNGQVLKNVGYWIVRNSWGTAWNDKGFFNIAMPNKKLGINNKLQIIEMAASFKADILPSKPTNVSQHVDYPECDNQATKESYNMFRATNTKSVCPLRVLVFLIFIVLLGFAIYLTIKKIQG